MKNLIHWTTLFVWVLFSPALFALGLGGAEVESYLDRPLDVRIELISQSGEELQSVTAGLASAQDFQLLGMNRAAISVPLEFELVTDTDRPYIHITSQLSINEPVVQVLVEVIWASGRMLREYTLFLDPPTFDSPAPAVAVKPAEQILPKDTAASTTASVQRTPTPPEPEPEPVVEAPEPEPVVEASEPVSEELPADEPVEASTDDDTSSSADTAESYSEPESTETEPADERFEEEQVYGPVARGETLWGIANDFSKGSGYSVNQAMLALQRKNPDAFIKNNINSLKRGAILRLPAINELGDLSSREAMLEVMRQEDERRTGIRSVEPDFNTPTITDSGDYQETTNEELAPVAAEEDMGHLELVPPAPEENAETPGLGEEEAQDLDSEMVREELSRTEEELVNVQQENTYLNQRIAELEAQAAEQDEPVDGIQDTELANLESTLAEERAEDKPEAPVAVTPGGEDEAWYAGWTPLILGAVVLLIALLVWGLRRKNAGQVAAAGPVAALAEAEEILRTLDDTDDEAKTVVQAAPELVPDIQAEPEAKPEPEPEPEPQPEPEPELAEDLVSSDDEGVTVIQKAPEPEAGFAIGFADDDSSDLQPAEEDVASPADSDTTQEDDDPEVKLDLARAYLSLGDKEASKSMLDEVLKNGNDAQKAEAQQMLEEF